MDATISYNQISGFRNGMGMNYLEGSTANCDILYNTLTNMTAGTAQAIFNEIGVATFATGTGSIIGNQISNNNNADTVWNNFMEQVQLRQVLVPYFN